MDYSWLLKLSVLNSLIIYTDAFEFLVQALTFARNLHYKTSLNHISGDTLREPDKGIFSIITPSETTPSCLTMASENPLASQCTHNDCKIANIVTQESHACGMSTSGLRTITLAIFWEIITLVDSWMWYFVHDTCYNTRQLI